MTTMISYKVLMTLTVIFIISSKAGKVEDDEKVKNCINYLSELGFSSGYGFLNFCIVHQYSDITQFRKSLETHRVAFVNFTPGSRDMTVKEEIITKFIEDNFKINSEHNIPTPIEFCREHNYVGCGFAGCLSNMLRSRAKIEAKKTEQYRKCEEEITKEYERITTIIPATNENGVERPQRQESVYQNFSTENRCENVVVSYNLMVHKYSEDTIKAIDETVQLWPGSKRGYLNKLLEDFEIQNQSYRIMMVFSKAEKYLSKQKWCMQYYKQEPIQGSTSGTNPPSEK